MKGFNKKIILLFSLTAILAACSAGGQNEERAEDILIYANLRESGPDREAIDEINRTHEDGANRGPGLP